MNKGLLVNMPIGIAKFIDKNYMIPRHIEYLNKRLMEVKQKPIRLIVSMPPRHGKSELTSKYFPFWYLVNRPDKRVILTSYESEFATSWGRKVRRLIEEYGSIFDTGLKSDSKASHQFEMVQGGGMQTVGIGGALTGKGADLLIIDDPVKNNETANSVVQRTKIWDWFTTTAYTRLEPNGSCVIVMTRWHEDDLAGRLVKEYGDVWEYVSIPAIAGPSDVLGREEGKALWSQRYDIEKLNELRTQLGSYWFNSLYQQIPIDVENQIFKDEWINVGSIGNMKYDIILQSYDTAFKKGQTNDYTVCTTIGVYQRKVYIIDIKRGKFNFPELLQIVNTQYNLYKPNLILIEDAASGQSLIQTLQSASYLPIKPIKPSADKVTRAHSVTYLFESNRVIFNQDIKDLNKMLDEISSFPLAPHDDVIDSITQALIYLSSMLNASPSIAIKKPLPKKSPYSL